MYLCSVACNRQGGSTAHEYPLLCVLQKKSISAYPNEEDTTYATVYKIV